ncbi:hypothetical protein GF378_01865 [Candidatus Pacearchaeota archaeon]|nr:hypothetical protein [Candidatus Pacearchaeota archaeon]
MRIMKKLSISVILMFLVVLFVLPGVLAINVSIEKLATSEDTIVKGLNQPAIIDLKVTNNGVDDEFLFYNLLGFVMKPEKPVEIDSHDAKTVQLTIYPRKDLDVKNYFNMQYFVRAESDESEIEKKATIKIIELQDAFEIGSGEIDPESNSIDVYIHNKEKISFEDLNVKFTSQFFELEETINLNANQRKDFTIELNKEDFDELTAGFYTLHAKVGIENVSAEIEGTIKFAEKNIVETTEKDWGLVVSTKSIKKTNEGNIIEETSTTVTKNIISRLFTSFQPKPDIVERKGLGIVYTWNQEIKPGKSSEILVKTNWLYPFLIIILIVVIVVLVKKYKDTDVQVRKRVKFVRAKGGEFALKVTLHVYAKNYVERINIVDRLPPLMKVYKRFGGEKPSRVNQEARIIEWDFEKFEPGEVRTLSYIIYSKDVGVTGRFALPSAAAIYQRLGKVKESTSNKAFFVSEQKAKDDDINV